MRRSSREDDSQGRRSSRASHEMPVARALTATMTASLGQAMSASVIGTLEDAHSYEADETSIGFSRDGEILPANSKKKQFPRGMKRLRDRLQILDDRLRLDVNALKQQISDLQLHRTLLTTKIQIQQPQMKPSATPPRGSGREQAAETVAEYFRAFEFGWILPVDSDDEDGVARLNRSLASRQTRRHGQRIIVEDEEKLSAGDEADIRAFQRERLELLVGRQRSFLSTALDPTMQTAGGNVGVDSFVQVWTTSSRYHDVVRLSLTSMSCHGPPSEPIVIAHGSRSGFITWTLLQALYPSALNDPSLVKQLVGVFIEYPTREVFLFGEQGKIVGYEADVDIVKALHDVVGDVLVVERLLISTFDDAGDERSSRAPVTL